MISFGFTGEYDTIFLTAIKSKDQIICDWVIQVSAFWLVEKLRSAAVVRLHLPVTGGDIWVLANVLYITPIVYE